MYACPHCDATSISWLEKAWSGSASPARCRDCGHLSYVRTFWHVWPGLVATLVLTGGLWVAIALGSAVVAVFGALACCGLFAYAFHRERLVPTSIEQVAAGRPYAWGMVALIGLVVAAAVLWPGHARSEPTAAHAGKALVSTRVPAAPNLSIERTYQSPLRALWSAAHVGR